MQDTADNSCWQLTGGSLSIALPCAGYCSGLVIYIKKIKEFLEPVHTLDEEINCKDVNKCVAQQGIVLCLLCFQ